MSRLTCYGCAEALQDENRTYCDRCQPLSCDACNTYVAEGAGYYPESAAGHPDENVRLCAECAA